MKTKEEGTLFWCPHTGVEKLYEALAKATEQKIVWMSLFFFFAVSPGGLYRELALKDP